MKLSYRGACLFHFLASIYRDKLMLAGALGLIDQTCTLRGPPIQAACCQIGNYLFSELFNWLHLYIILPLLLLGEIFLCTQI